MLTMKMLASALAVSALTAFSAAAQTQPDEIRRLLGEPVDVIAAAGFAATTASHRDLCGKPPEFDGHAEIIMRLEFGALEADAREQYTAAMIRQYQSNASIYGTLDGDAKRSFCRGLNSAVLHRSAEFFRKHPKLFEAKAPPPEP